MNDLRHFMPAYALAFVITTPAFANPSQTGIEEIVVTATRRPAVSTDISTALSVIHNDELGAVKLVTDALSSQPGVYLQQTTPGQGAAIIRGLKGSAILHLVDGVPLSNAIFRSAPTPYLALVPTTAVERIEVVRGTPASLYGSQAVGGVIQVVSRVPTFESAETEFRGDVTATFDTADRQQSIKGTLDVGNKQLAGSLSAEYLSTGDRRVGGGERIGPTGYTSKAARLLVSATPTEDRAWLFDVQALEQPMTPRIDELVPGFGQTQASSSEFFFAPNRRLFAHVQHKVSDSLFGANWRFDAAWQRIDDDRVTRDFEAATRRHESNRSDLFSFSVNASGKARDVSWIVGTDIQTDKVRSSRTEEDINSMLRTSVQSRFPDGANIDQVALFANADLALSDKQHIIGGLRVSDIRIDVPASVALEASRIDVRRLSGDVGWTYTLNDTWQLVANAGFGFRAPNIADLGTLGNRPGNRFNIPNTDLKEERVRQLDAGIRGNTESLRFELMVFALRFEDRITSALTGDTTIDGRDIVQSVNTGRSSVRGAEVGMEIDITDRVNAQAVLNYTWGEEEYGAINQPADRIPPLSGRLGLDVSLSDQWVSRSWLSLAGDQDRLSDRDIRDVRINPEGTAGWAILGTGLTWTPTPIWEIDLSADNLLDKRYRVHGSGMDASGRNIRITFRSRW